MKNILNMTIIVLTILLLQGCADMAGHLIITSVTNWGKTVEMKNNEGHIVECTVSKASAVFNGRRNRDKEIEQCVHAYEKQGYRALAQGK